MEAEETADKNGGAYLLFLRVAQAIEIPVGRRGLGRLAPGRYVYVGSARRGLSQRVARHTRLATTKSGKRHWHIDALLLHHAAALEDVRLLPGAEECEISHRLSKTAGVSVPLPGFGATDCRAGCPAHLYRNAGKIAWLT